MREVKNSPVNKSSPRGSHDMGAAATFSDWRKTPFPSPGSDVGWYKITALPGCCRNYPCAGQIQNVIYPLFYTTYIMPRSYIFQLVYSQLIARCIRIS